MKKSNPKKNSAGNAPADRNAIMEQALVKLRSIQTLDEFKAAHDDIIDLIEKIMVSAIKMLKAFFEKMSSMSQEEQQAESMKFQDGDFLISPEVMQEVERLNDLPGGKKYAKTFSLELEKIMKPHMDEFSQVMDKLMENFMGGLMGGMVDAMGKAFDAGFSDTASAQEPEPAFDENNPDQLILLYALYTSGSLSDLEEIKASLIENLEMELDEKKSNLDNYLLPGFEITWDDDKRRISESERLAERLIPELEKEFARISDASDSAGAIEEIKEEARDRLEPKVTNLKEYLAIKKTEWQQSGF